MECSAAASSRVPRRPRVPAYHLLANLLGGIWKLIDAGPRNMLRYDGGRRGQSKERSGLLSIVEALLDERSGE
jgi:hypothetical protein